MNYTTSRLYPADKIKDASDSGGSNIEHDNDVESERTNLFVKEIPDILDRVILIAAVYLEFGVLPIQYEVELRKLYFFKIYFAEKSWWSSKNGLQWNVKVPMWKKLGKWGDGSPHTVWPEHWWLACRDNWHKWMEKILWNMLWGTMHFGS